MAGVGVLLRVRDVMTPNPVTMPPTATVEEAVKLMAERDIGSILVVDESGRLAGIFTERDAVKRVLAQGRDPRSTRLSEVMTPNPITIDVDSPVEDAVRLMERKRIRHLPVVDREGRLVGIVSLRDIEAALL
ncbi:MAG: CBS domain-containing protein [Desulfurococcales archaeon]|nr:CBS domain-containing protein [Desulfurococcales archaeon]